MAWEMKYQPNVVLDFDGVIHSYVSGWQGVDVVLDPPVPLIDEEIKRIRAAGYRVVVVSTRCATPEGMGAVRRYLRENGIEVDDVAAEKPPAKVYVDDRALLFDGNPKGLLEKIQQFRPWQEGGPLRGKPPVPNCRKCIAHVYERTNDGWREDEFVAWFHTWGSTFEEFDNGAVLSQRALSRTSTARCGARRRRTSGSSTERRTADAD